MSSVSSTVIPRLATLSLIASLIFCSLSDLYFSLILSIRCWTSSYDSLCWLRTYFSRLLISNNSLFLNWSIFFSNLICSKKFLCFSALSFLSSACSDLINFCKSIFLSLSSFCSSLSSVFLAFKAISLSLINFLMYDEFL